MFDVQPDLLFTSIKAIAGELLLGTVVLRRTELFVDTPHSR